MSRPRRLARALALLLFCLAAWPGASSAAESLIELEPGIVTQGQVVLLKVCLPGQAFEAQALRARFLGQEAPLVRGVGGCWVGALAADLNASPGPHEIEVKAGEMTLARRQVKVAAKDYGTRQITVAQKYVAPSREQLDRHQGEMERQRQAYSTLDPVPLWRGPWLAPLDAEVVGIFGRRSLVNGEPRSPHGGVDLRGGVGTPVRAPAAGRVAYLEDTYFGGITLLIDHGLGLISGYRHLSEAKVGPGQEVRQGQVIGLVGMSGRVTGPHLHFDMHLMGARVDPLAWVATSRRLALMLGGS